MNAPSAPSVSPAYQLCISIVLYNPDIDKLKACLYSVFQSKLNLHVYLVDNSAAPLDEALLEAWGAKISYIFGHGNVGFGAGHNLVMLPLMQQAPYWLILNPDTYFGSGLLEELHARMQADARIGVCIPHIRNPDGSTQLVNKRLPTPAIFFLRPYVARMALFTRVPVIKSIIHRWMNRFLLKDMDLTRPLICPFVSGCFMFFRSSLLAELKGFDERYFLYMEDLDLSRRAAMRGLNVMFSDVDCFHHWERTAYKNPKVFRMMVRSCIQYFNKWGWVLDFRRVRMNHAVRYYESPVKN